MNAARASIGPSSVRVSVIFHVRPAGLPLDTLTGQPEIVSEPCRTSHYSVKSALGWIGCGGRIIEVPTRGYRYDLAALERTLRQRQGEIMAVVAYTGDSRTHTVENLRAVHDLTRAVDPRIWLHADACWDLMCAFAPELAPKLAGIEDFDSVTVDPHKVMDIPYAMSALLVRDPASLRLVSSYSGLIMQEDFAFGQSPRSSAPRNGPPSSCGR
ncbi:pyridoxal-dependent decarboxylase [Streptomyces sp. 2RAF24]